MILSAQSIRQRVQPDSHSWGQLEITPFYEKTVESGLSFGLSSCGYDIRIGSIDRDQWISTQTGQFDPTQLKGKPATEHWINTGEFLLIGAHEFMAIPNDLCARVLDKSTWARQGLAVQNTIIEPGWKGFLTLELTNHGPKRLQLLVGMPIAQIVFEQLDYPTDLPYKGKYQDQPSRPIHAIME